MCTPPSHNVERQIRSEIPYQEMFQQPRNAVCDRLTVFFQKAISHLCSCFDQDINSETDFSISTEAIETRKITQMSDPLNFYDRKNNSSAQTITSQHTKEMEYEHETTDAAYDTDEEIVPDSDKNA
jgi:hypothetical protein